jgi:hypothetical protein
MNQLDPQLRLSYEQLKYIRHECCPKGYVMVKRFRPELEGVIEHCIPPTGIEQWTRVGWQVSEANNSTGVQHSYSLVDVKQIIQAHQIIAGAKDKGYCITISSPNGGNPGGEGYWAKVTPIGCHDQIVSLASRPTFAEAVIAVAEVLPN